MHPYSDRDETHEIYRDWRRIVDAYDPPRALIGEIRLPDTERFIEYLNQALAIPGQPTAPPGTCGETSRVG